ncbi:MAG: hypothetical protein R2764_11955 [Bacteroidales bacterium]
MNKILPIFIVIALTLTSCIEIIEEITINKDQSGSISYRLETGELSSILSNFAGFFENDFEKQMKEKVNEFARKLKGVEGISNLKYSANPRTGEFELKADFDNAKALNKALYQAFGYEKKTFSPGYLKISRHKFKRNNISPYIKQYLEREEFQMSSEHLLGMISFRTSVILPNKAKGYKPGNAKSSDGGKKISVTYPAEDIINNTTSMKCSIKY